MTNKNKYYDTEKYKRTAADRKHAEEKAAKYSTSQKDESTGDT